MNPNECLLALMNAVREGDDKAIREYSKALEKWLEQGGEMPEVNREHLVMFCQSVDMLAERMEADRKVEDRDTYCDSFQSGPSR